MMQDRTFRGQSADGVWHEGFLIRSPGVKNSRPGEGWYINSEQEPAFLRGTFWKTIDAEKM